VYPNKIFSNCSILLFLIFSQLLNAQTVENNINIYGASFPREKIHIHFDKETYLPGETIWFKAYLFEENLLSERSTNFYAAIYNEEGILIKQLIKPLFAGTTDGQFDIPDSLKSNQIICRAYTSWMMNFDTSMLFVQSIKIVNAPVNRVVKDVKTTSLNFFPEGGNLIEGTVNTIAFKANYNDGQPFLINGLIKKQQTGEIIVPFVCKHDGMGRLDIDIQPGDKYYAEWVDNNGTKRQTLLPEAKPAGVSLKLAMQKGMFYFNLFNKTSKDSLHVLMYMYQKVFYKVNLKVPAGESFTGSIPINTLPTGIMQMTIFDADWQPVAERVAFINNNNYIFNANVFSKEISTQKRGKNMLEISVPDTIPANMSLSISDANLNNERSENTILSNLLLKGDLKGYIHKPAFYFSNALDVSLKDKLDLVMLTNGWRRYNQTDMTTQKMPAIKYPADEYLGVYGQVGKEVMSKIEKEERVNLIIKTADSTSNFYVVMPDKAGLLKQTGLVFYDSAKVYFTFNKNKDNNSQIAFSKYNFTNPPGYAIHNYKHFLLPDTALVLLNGNTALGDYYLKVGKMFYDKKTLKDVIVKTSSRRKWQNDPLLKIDEKYAKGLFAGGASGYAIDVLHDEKAWTKLDVYQYLRTAMPGISIGGFNNLSGRSISFNRRAVLIFIDEHQMTETDLENLDISKVAYIKLIPFYPASGMDDDGFALKAALSVYTKKGDDLIERRPTDKDLGIIKIAGYTPLKEFYSPDYAETNATEGYDARTTLLWMPYILTDKFNKKVPVIFYNNDFTKKMRIVLEGVNEDGKMIRIEKVIE
jgi:hypothetical protein